MSGTILKLSMGNDDWITGILNLSQRKDLDKRDKKLVLKSESATFTAADSFGYILYVMICLNADLFHYYAIDEGMIGLKVHVLILRIVLQCDRMLSLGEPNLHGV